MSSPTTTFTGTVARIEWERFHHVTAAILLLNDGRIVHVHPQGLGETGQDHLALTRDGDAVEITQTQEPEAHVCRFINQGIAKMAATN